MNYEKFKRKVEGDFEKHRDGWKNPVSFIHLPTNEVAVITYEDDEYSCLLHDSDGNPILSYINTDNLYEMYVELMGE